MDIDHGQINFKMKTGWEMSKRLSCFAGMSKLNAGASPDLFELFRKFSNIFAISITFYSEPLKNFRSPRKQFPDKSENNLPSLYRHLPILANICRICDEWRGGVAPPPPFLATPLTERVISPLYNLCMKHNNYIRWRSLYSRSAL
jgi:hypothetical protein